MVEGDNLVEEHQVNVLEIFGIVRVIFERRLAVANVVVGEIADQSAGKGRQIFKARAFIIRQNFANARAGIVRLESLVVDFHDALRAGYAKFRVVAKEGVMPPFFVLGDGFENVAMRGNIFQNPQNLNRRANIRHKLAA